MEMKKLILAAALTIAATVAQAQYTGTYGIGSNHLRDNLEQRCVDCDWSLIRDRALKRPEQTSASAF
jgi:hypothetical protein